MSAMWMGAASPHRQYVQPFRPMNALEKLLDANGYRRYVSMDHIMEQLLTPVPGLVPLDAGIPELEYDFCRTLEEIDTKLGDGQASQPFLAHTRSLNLHVASLNRASVPSGESYPGFEERYAARVRRMDGCFGRFIDVLKRLDGRAVDLAGIIGARGNRGRGRAKGRAGQGCALPAKVRSSLHHPCSASR
jgi:hypothetical protein